MRLFPLSDFQHIILFFLWLHSFLISSPGSCVYSGTLEIRSIRSTRRVGFIFLLPLVGFFTSATVLGAIAESCISVLIYFSVFFSELPFWLLPVLWITAEWVTIVFTAASSVLSRLVVRHSPLLLMLLGCFMSLPEWLSSIMIFPSSTWMANFNLISGLFASRFSC